MKIGATLWGLIALPFLIVNAQETVEISEVVVQQLEPQLIRISLEIINSTSRSLSEVAGYIEIFDNSERLIDKKFTHILHVHDVPLEPYDSKSRSIVMTRRPNMSGTARFRITHLRFFGEQDVYLVCPNCGEIIPKD